MNQALRRGALGVWAVFAMGCGITADGGGGAGATAPDGGSPAADGGSSDAQPPCVGPACEPQPETPYVPGPTVACETRVVPGRVDWTQSMEAIDCDGVACAAWFPRIDLAADGALLVSSELFRSEAIFPTGVWFARFDPRGALVSSSTPILISPDAEPTADYRPFGRLADDSLLIRESVFDATRLRRFRISGEEIPGVGENPTLQHAAVSSRGGFVGVLVETGEEVPVELITEPGGEVYETTSNQPEVVVAAFDELGRMRWANEELSPAWGKIQVNYSQFSALALDDEEKTTHVVVFEQGNRAQPDPEVAPIIAFMHRLVRLDDTGEIVARVSVPERMGLHFAGTAAGSSYCLWHPIVQQPDGFFNADQAVLERFDEGVRSEWMLPVDRVSAPTAELEVDPQGNAVISRIRRVEGEPVLTFTTVSKDGATCEVLEVPMPSACRDVRCDLRAVRPRGDGSFYFATEFEIALAVPR